MVEEFSQDFGDAEDALSLCNLPIDDYELDPSFQSRRGSVSSDQDPFEFGSGPELLVRNDSVVLWDRNGAVEVNEYRKRDYLCVKAASFHKAPVREEREDWSVGRDRAVSLRIVRSPPVHPVQKVNITAITSMSAKSRRRMFMFGPVKFKPEMDVAEIKKRRSRHPMTIPPMPEEGQVVATAGRKEKSGSGNGGMMRPLWCRSHLATVLARSFGCISASIV
ncbi:VPS10 2 like [Actinidia chinensis var. chinensis]|uniref:VPS10 2 like n=1 Tax=Actinidia chinensis var. chinensis TaxID=1590841 RepID=A0A2R6PLT0_ACTCC|nr:VPS10 2 like [Actinidia chinensis var. chinensis]